MDIWIIAHFFSTTNSAAVHHHTSITAYGRVLGEETRVRGYVRLKF